MRATRAIGLVSLLVLGLCASTASAAPLSMTFTEARANVGVQLFDAALFAAPDTAPFEAQIGPAGESIAAGELYLPQFATHITTPIDADVTVDFDYPGITGSFVSATGELTLSGVIGSTLTSGGKECTVSTTPEVLTLSTGGSSGGATPRFGSPFVAGLTGAGSIAGQWTDMQTAPVDPGPGGDTVFCESVEEYIEGPGGLWLEQEGDLVPPSAPQLTGTDPASPGSSGTPSPGSSGTPRIRGDAEAGSTVRVYASPGCAGTPVAIGSAAELGSPGIRVEVGEGVTAAFSATATDAAGNASACSAPISYAHLKKACVVPSVAGKKLKAAKRKIKAAGCRVGEIRKPKRLKGKGRRPLVVKSSKPAAGATPADGTVDLRLGPKPKKARY